MRDWSVIEAPYKPALDNEASMLEWSCTDMHQSPDDLAGVAVKDNYQNCYVLKDKSSLNLGTVEVSKNMLSF